MIDAYKFHFEPNSLVLGRKTGVGDWRQQAIEPGPKPVYAIHTQGWLVIDLPGQVVKALGRTTLHKTKSAPVLLLAHFETEPAIYQLHVNTRVQLALPNF